MINNGHYVIFIKVKRKIEYGVVSKMKKVTSGIKGLNDMLNGGFPEGHAIVVMGSFGTGKSTFALQFITAGLMQPDRENGIFISLEEDEESILDSAKSYGWDLEQFVKDGSLHIVKLDPADARTTVKQINSELPQFIKQSGARRVVIDSVSLLNMMYDNMREARTSLFSLIELIKSTGATLLMTAEVSSDNPRSSRDGLVEYTADGVVLLQYRVPEDLNKEVKLSIQVIKMRRVKHSRSVKPYEITDNGIVVHTSSEVF